MNMPTATYRIQFNPAFGFKNAQPVISYLADLGISDLYASPIFKAVKGSLHGYDVVDPNHLNPELGALSDLEGLAAELQSPQHGVDSGYCPESYGDGFGQSAADGYFGEWFQLQVLSVFRRGLGLSGRQPQQENSGAISWLVLWGMSRKWRDRPPIRS